VGEAALTWRVNACGKEQTENGEQGTDNRPFVILDGIVSQNPESWPARREAV